MTDYEKLSETLEQKPLTPSALYVLLKATEVRFLTHTSIFNTLDVELVVKNPVITISDTLQSGGDYSLKAIEPFAFARINAGYSELCAKGILVSRAAKTILKVLAEQEKELLPGVNFHYSAMLCFISTTAQRYIAAHPEMFDGVKALIASERNSVTYLASKYRRGDKTFGVNSLFRVVRETKSSYFVVFANTDGSDGSQQQYDSMLTRRNGHQVIAKSDVYAYGITLAQFAKLKAATQEYWTEDTKAHAAMAEEIKKLQDAYKARDIQKQAMYAEDLNSIVPTEN